MPTKEAPLVWIDLEMTGLDPDRCHILEIATVITNGDLTLTDSFVCGNTGVALGTTGTENLTNVAFTCSP